MNEYQKYLDEEVQDIWNRIAESTAMPEEDETDDDEDTNGVNV